MPDKYTVKKYTSDEIDQFRDEWQRLYVGKDMTYNQSYAWHSMLIRYTPRPQGVDCNFRLVEKDGEPMMIAPLWVITRRIGVVNAPGVYFIGRESYTDYINLIYDRFDSMAFEALLEDVRREYGNLPWHFELLKETSALFGYLKQLGAENLCKIHQVSRTGCAAIALPESRDAYLKSLKKSMIERLHRLANRAKKDNVNFEILINDPSYTSKCTECYNVRNATLKRRAKEAMSKKARVYFFVRGWLYDRWLIKFPKYVPYVEDPNVSVIAVVDKSSDQVAAFLSFVEDRRHHTIQVVQVALNEEYSRYSPGIMVAKYLIDKGIDDGDFSWADFTRGEEQYKYDLGCQTHYLRTLTVKFK